MLLLAAIVSPVLEFFDRWDTPGLGNDTEFATFALILIVCLLLAVCKLLSDRAKTTDIDLLPPYLTERPPAPCLARHFIDLPVLPAVSPPLRI